MSPVSYTHLDVYKRQDGEWVEIREGLKAGDGVVTAGKIALRDGTPVEVIGDKAGKTATAKVEVEAAGKKK